MELTDECFLQPQSQALVSWGPSTLGCPWLAAEPVAGSEGGQRKWGVWLRLCTTDSIVLGSMEALYIFSSSFH